MVRLVQRIVQSVWIGKDNHKDIEGLYGGTYPAEIWKEAMLSMYN